jgi:FkbM family methyltransferase
MLDLSFIDPQSLLGQTLRLPLRLVPLSAEVRILQGALRGKKWVVGSSNHRCWLGFYEASKQKKLAEYIHAGMICYDLGANVGLYSLLFSVLTGPTGSVVAFEPLPENVLRLWHHLEINDCRNGMAGFSRSRSNCQGCLSQTGDLYVRSCRLDTRITEDNLSPPNLMKIDVEGAEARVLEGARKTIFEHKPVIAVATHGPQPHYECCQWLRAMNYDIQPLDSRTVESATELLALPRR